MALARGDTRRLALGDFGCLFLPSDWLEYDRTLAAMRACLGDPILAQAWAEGERMTPHQAVEAALAVSGQGFAGESPDVPGAADTLTSTLS